MHFIADESVDAPIFREMRDTVYAIAEESPGIPDDMVLQLAVNQKGILLTQDKDFGELVYRLGKAHFGVVLIRLAGLGTIEKASLTALVINKHLLELPQAFTVIYKDYLKIRKPNT